MNTTTAGVLFWTPAPKRSSPASSLTADGGCEDEEEEEDANTRMEKEEDFHSQMDENGIIGLRDALEGLELTYGDADYDGQCDPCWFHGAVDGKEACSTGPGLDLELGTLSEELSYSLSELQDSLSQNDPPGEDAHTAPSYENMTGSVEVWTEDEELRQREEEEELRWLAQSTVLTVEEDKDETAQESIVVKQKRREHAEMGNYAAGSNTTRKVLVKSHVARDDNGNMKSPRTSSVDQLAFEANGPSSRNHKRGIGPQNRSGLNTFGSGTLSAFASSNLLCPISQSPPTSRPPSHPHLLHFSSEELASSPGIGDETFPETASTESLPESYSSRMSQTSKHGWPHESEGAELKHRSSYPLAITPKQDASRHRSGISVCRKRESEKSAVNHSKGHPPSLSKERQCSPETKYSRSSSLKKTHAGSPDRGRNIPRKSPSKSRSINSVLGDGRMEPLSYSTPDFSKIEPRIHFPKSGYTPPKSTGSSRKSLAVEPPIVFMSPADIVREVLFSSTDGLASPDPQAPNHTVPEEFRCPHQATTLMEQLQEDYNRLLTKYAEAENTIDRLRLEAKVNLYSDPPKPSHADQSGIIHQGSRVMTLNIPQAQRADLGSTSVHPSGTGPHQRTVSSPGSSSVGSNSSRRSFGPHMAQALTQTLSKHANRFFQQVQTFEDILKSGRLKPFEQMTGVSQLAQGLYSIERGYLVAKDEHRLLQHSGAAIGPFDPDRELEGLIFQCGMHVEELKELAEQENRGQPVPEAPAFPPPHPSTPLPSERREATPHPERPVLPLPGATGGAAGVEVSSASRESEEQEAGMVDEEDCLLPLRSVDSRDTLVEPDFSPLMDHYQSFREPPKLDRNLMEEDLFPPGPAEGVQPDEEEEEKEEPKQEPENMELHNINISQRNAKSGCRDAPAVPTAKPRSSNANPPFTRALDQSPVPPARIPSGTRRSAGHKSHSSSLTSLGESPGSERRPSKLEPGSTRVLSQDGIISPETDSGFIGSECSRHTPAAVASPLHQRATGSGSGPPERRVSGQSVPSTSPSHRASLGPGSPGQTQGQTRTRTRRGPGPATASGSPQNWARHAHHLTAASGSSEFGLDSEPTNTVSEDEDGTNGQFAQCCPGPSPASPYRHDDPLCVNRNEAIQNLHAEVTRLKERLESSLRHARSPCPVQPPRWNHTPHHTAAPRIRVGQQRRDGSGEERRDRSIIGPEDDPRPRLAQKKRSASALKHSRPRPDTLTATDSEQDVSTPRPQRCRHEPGLPPALEQSCTLPANAGSSRPTTRQHSGLSTAPSEPVELDEADSRASQNPVCPQCSSSPCPGRSANPGGGSTEPSRTCARHCPLCGLPEHYRHTASHQACRKEREADFTTSPGRAAPVPSVSGGVPLVHCVPLCPTPLLLYSSPAGRKMDSYLQPFYVSVSNNVAQSSGVRGRMEVRGRERTGRPSRSLSVDRQRSLNGSLNTAIRAARDMKHTSRHMARSLAGGLHYQDLLSQSCTY